MPGRLIIHKQNTTLSAFLQALNIERLSVRVAAGVPVECDLNDKAILPETGVVYILHGRN
jgi:hypothetical protein